MGKLIFDNGKFHFAASLTSERGGTARQHAQAKAAGLQWNAETLRWVTRKPHKAVKLRQWADPSAEQKFKRYFITEYPLPGQIIYPDHLSPRSFQIESALHCLTRSPAYCADDAGLGKTITSILCMNTVPGKTLIICPPYLVHNWAAELEGWLVGEELQASVSIIAAGDSDEKLFCADILILPDSLVTNPRIKALLAMRNFLWLFVDEAHRYKEATTQRTQSLVGKEDDPKWDYITKYAERVVLLSGTPIPNGRPIELYPLLSQLAPEAIGHRSLAEYGKQFCGGKRVVRYEGNRAIVNWDFKGHSNLQQLRRELREKLMIRHLKRDVLKELGPKTRKIIFLDEVETLKSYEKRVLKNYTLEELMGADYSLGDIATYRKEVGIAKINPAFLYISELLESSGDKLVVFANHIEVVETLTRMLEPFNPVMIRGGVSRKEKAARVKRFQTDPDCRAAVGNMESMGTGNTMTAAPGVVVVEPDWRPGINEQAEDRVHRMTQDSNVYIRYLVLRNSLDERMLTQVLNKQDAIASVMD